MTEVIILALLPAIIATVTRLDPRDLFRTMPEPVSVSEEQRQEQCRELRAYIEKHGYAGNVVPERAQKVCE